MTTSRWPPSTARWRGAKLYFSVLASGSAPQSNRRLTRSLSPFRAALQMKILVQNCPKYKRFKSAAFTCGDSSLCRQPGGPSGRPPLGLLGPSLQWTGPLSWSFRHSQAGLCSALGGTECCRPGPLTSPVSDLTRNNIIFFKCISKYWILSKILTMNNDPVPVPADRPGQGSLLQGQVAQDLPQEMGCVGGKGSHIGLEALGKVGHDENQTVRAVKHRKKTQIIIHIRQCTSKTMLFLHSDCRVLSNSLSNIKIYPKMRKFACSLYFPLIG